MTAPHLAHQTFAHTRSKRFNADELGAIASAKQRAYVNDKPYLFEQSQEVIVTKKASRLYMMVGIVANRRGGSPARYSIRFGSVSTPFLETDLTAWHSHSRSNSASARWKVMVAPNVRPLWQ